MEKSEILTKLVGYYAQGNKSRFSKMLGLAPGTVSCWIQRNTFDVDIISTKCKEINYQWLITGDGEMLQSASPETIANSEMKKLVDELKGIYYKINADLEEERAIHVKTIELLQRALDIYEKKLDVAAAEVGVKKAI